MTRKKKMKPIPKKPETDMKENIGKILINTGQVIFATLFLGGVINGKIPQYIMLIAGLSGAMLFCVVGLLLSAKVKK